MHKVTQVREPLSLATGHLSCALRHPQLCSFCSLGDSLVWGIQLFLGLYAPPSPLALPRIVSPPEEAMADNTPQARSSGLWASQHPTCFLCEMTDSCTVSTAPLLSQHSADPRQTQPRPGIDVRTACLLSREQNRIHPAASASKQARSPGPGRP